MFICDDMISMNAYECIYQDFLSFNYDNQYWNLRYSSQQF